MEQWAEDKTNRLLSKYGPQRYNVREENRAWWDRIEGNTGKKMSDKIRFQLEMYCQGSIYMTVQWVLGNHKATPETLARFLSESMPAELRDVFKERGLL